MPSSASKKAWSWACFDFANSAYGTLVLTFIYNTYFTKAIAVSESDGTRLWGMTVAIASMLARDLGAVDGVAPVVAGAVLDVVDERLGLAEGPTRR